MYSFDFDTFKLVYTYLTIYYYANLIFLVDLVYVTYYNLTILQNSAANDE